MLELNKKNEIFNREDALVIAKILLESRAFCEAEIKHLINVILGQVNSEQRKCIKEIIGNEFLNFVPLKHNKNLLNMLWNLSECIRHKEIISIKYIKNNGSNVERKIKPLAIVFSEFNFYLIAHIVSLDFDFPAVFRVDRIVEYKIQGEKILYSRVRKVYGKGIMMWILSQAQFLKVLEPNDFREEIKKTILEIKNIYE